MAHTTLDLSIQLELQQQAHQEALGHTHKNAERIEALKPVSGGRLVLLSTIKSKPLWEKQNKYIPLAKAKTLDLDLQAGPLQDLVRAALVKREGSEST